MNDKEADNLRRFVANRTHIWATPIDFNKFVEDGALKKIGQSYYVNNPEKLTKEFWYKVSAAKQTKNGLKLTFYKETKQIKRFAEDSKEWRD